MCECRFLHGNKTKLPCESLLSSCSSSFPPSLPSFFSPYFFMDIFLSIFFFSSLFCFSPFLFLISLLFFFFLFSALFSFLLLSLLLLLFYFSSFLHHILHLHFSFLLLCVFILRFHSFPCHLPCLFPPCPFFSPFCSFSSVPLPISTLLPSFPLPSFLC